MEIGDFIVCLVCILRINTDTIDSSVLKINM